MQLCKIFVLLLLSIVTPAESACTIGLDCSCDGTGCICNANFFGASSTTPATQICLPCPAGQTSSPNSASCVQMTSSARPTPTTSATMSPSVSATATASSSASAMASINPIYAPIMLSQTCTVQEQTIFLNAPVGTAVSCNGIAGGPVLASDILNSSLTYMIIDGNSEGLFSIIYSTGVIFLNSPVTCCTGLAKTDST